MSESAALDLTSLFSGAVPTGAHGALDDTAVTDTPFGTLLSSLFQGDIALKTARPQTLATTATTAGDANHLSGSGLARAISSQLSQDASTAAVASQTGRATAELANRHAESTRPGPGVPQLQALAKVASAGSDPAKPARTLDKITEAHVTERPLPLARLAPRTTTTLINTLHPQQPAAVIAPRTHTPSLKSATKQADGRTAGRPDLSISAAGSRPSAGDLSTQRLDNQLQAEALESPGDLEVFTKSIAANMTSKVAQAHVVQKERYAHGRNKLAIATNATASTGIASEATVQDRPLTSLTTESSLQLRQGVNTQSLASDIAHLKFSGQNQARVSLRPSHLGEVEIRLKVTQAGTQIELIAASDNAAELLNQSLPALRSQLTNSGINATTLEVSADTGTPDRESSFGAYRDQSDQTFQSETDRKYASGTDISVGEEILLDQASRNRQSRLLDARA